MAKGLNQIQIIGNVGKTPEVKVFDDGTKVAAFSVATSKSYKSESGEVITKTQWHRVVAWRALGEVVEKYVSKGVKIFVSGEMTYRTFEGNNGENKSIAEILANNIILLSPKSQGNSTEPQQQNQPPAENFQPEEHDDLPF